MLPLAGSREKETSRLEASSNASVCCNHQNQHSKFSNMICKSDGLNLDRLVKARKMGVLDLSPEDEVEGEIIYFQNRLLGNAVARKQFTGLFLVLLIFWDILGFSYSFILLLLLIYF
jgi:hypothetical protein